jgi:RNA methyltransferase, TrmH family
LKRITSRDNALYKQLHKLAHSSHERKKSAQTILDGAHLVRAYLDAIGAPRALIVSERARENAEIQALLARASVPVNELPQAMFNDIAPVQTPAGMLALIDTPAPLALPARLTSCIALEDIQDPGNLGAMLRSAAAAGIEHALLSRGCAFAWAPRVVRAGMGAHFALNIYEQLDLAQALAAFPGRIVATVASAERSLYELDLRGDIAFLIGNEGAGLSQALLDCAHERVRIPMPGARVESLNAAAAAAVCLFERVRQLEGSLREAPPRGETTR